MAASGGQVCSTPDCGQPAAFSTRSRPAWCQSCIADLFQRGGVRLATAFAGGRTSWQLTTCLTCQVQAHYRLDYVIDRSRFGEAVCRACYWRGWAAQQRAPWQDQVLALLADHTPAEIAELHPDPAVIEFLEHGWWRPDQIVARLDEAGFDLAGLTAPVTGAGDPVVTCCRACGRLSAERMGDVGFGCSCSRNQRAASPGRVLLADSDDPCLDWWDNELNSEADLATATLRARRSVHWVGPLCGHRFNSPVAGMSVSPTCPTCQSEAFKREQAENARLAALTVRDVPELAQAWADEANPASVSAAAGSLHRFCCPNGHHPRISPRTFLRNGCPHCRADLTRGSGPTLAVAQPEIASQWHPVRNGALTPNDVGPGSRRTVWWLADCCGHEWREAVQDRDKYRRWRCPSCRTFLDSLAWQNPGLASEWSPDNPVSPWQVRPHTSTSFTPQWVCATDPSHTWRAPLSSRSSGAGCPECRISGKSAVELSHFRAAAEVFGSARSGMVLRDDAFTGRNTWTVDIAVDLGDRLLIIEYDGAYWHGSDRDIEVDLRKTRDLLAAGHLVVRLREEGLPTLQIDHCDYLEITVYSAAPHPAVAMSEVLDWVDRQHEPRPRRAADGGRSARLGWKTLRRFSGHEWDTPPTPPCCQPSARVCDADR